MPTRAVAATAQRPNIPKSVKHRWDSRRNGSGRSLFRKKRLRPVPPYAAAITYVFWRHRMIPEGGRRLLFEEGLSPSVSRAGLALPLPTARAGRGASSAVRAEDGDVCDDSGEPWISNLKDAEGGAVRLLFLVLPYTFGGAPGSARPPRARFAPEMPGYPVPAHSTETETPRVAERVAWGSPACVCPDAAARRADGRRIKRCRTRTRPAAGHRGAAD